MKDVQVNDDVAFTTTTRRNLVHGRVVRIDRDQIQVAEPGRYRIRHWFIQRADIVKCRKSK